MLIYIVTFKALNIFDRYLYSQDLFKWFSRDKSWIPCNSCSYFNWKRHGIAIGVTMSGAGIGTFITGPFVQYLLNTYRLVGTFLLLAGFGVHAVVFGTLIRPKTMGDTSYCPNRQTENKSNALCSDIKNTLNFDIFLDKAFVCCGLLFLLWNMAFSIIMIHLVNFTVVQGTARESAAMLITYAGITSTIGRIVTGLALNSGTIDPLLLNFGFCSIMTFVTFPFPWYSRTFGGQIVFALIFGMYGGGLSTLMNPLCLEILGIEKVASGIGTVFFSWRDRLLRRTSYYRYCV